MSKVFPSILPTGDDFADDTYRKRELATWEYDELRSVAADHPSESVHGRMDRESLVSELAGLERL